MRGGTRGGRDQFNWEDVKASKHRENFLGHSVKATVGRWQNGRDLLWYSKSKPKRQDNGDKGRITGESTGASTSTAADLVLQEKQAVRQREEELYMEALGLKPKGSTIPKNHRRNQDLAKHELEELLRRGRTEEERDHRCAAGERIRGLGSGGVAASQQPQVLPERDVLSGEGLVDSFFDQSKEGKGSERREAETKITAERKHHRRLHKKRHRRHHNSREDDESTDKRHRRRHRRHHHRSKKRHRSHYHGNSSRSSSRSPSPNDDENVGAQTRRHDSD